MFQSNPTTLRHRAISLAGLWQALVLIQQVASIRGLSSGSTHYMHTSLNSVTVLSPKTIDEVYGGISGIELGLEKFEYFDQSIFTMRGELVGYFVDVLKVAGHLSQHQHKDMRDDMRKSLKQVRKQYTIKSSKTCDTGNVEFYKEVNDLYLNTISRLPHRISLFGHTDRLSVPAVTHKLRSLLMAAVRSAMLWRQFDGSIHGLLWEKKQIVEQAQHLLGQLKKHPSHH